MEESKGKQRLQCSFPIRSIGYSHTLSNHALIEAIPMKRKNQKHSGVVENSAEMPPQFVDTMALENPEGHAKPPVKFNVCNSPLSKSESNTGAA